MQLPIPYHKGQKKPWASVPRINWSHPLAADLVIYIYDVGATYVDLINGPLSLVTTSTNNPSITTSPYGGVLQYTGTAGSTVGYSVLAAGGHKAYTDFASVVPYTIVIGTILTNIVTGTLAGVATTTSTVNSYENGPTFNIDVSPVRGRWFFNLGGGFSHIDYNQQGAATFQTWGFVATDASNCILYGNGVFDKSGSPGNLNVSVGSYGKTGAFVVNSATSGGSTALISPGGLSQETGSMPFYAAWNRQLTATELKNLHDDPYCFLVYPEDMMFASLVGVVAAVSLPFNQFDYPLPDRVPRRVLDTSVALNPNLFKNNYPTFNGDQGSSRLVPDFLPWHPPQWIHRFPAVTAMPFNQFDWSKAFNIPQAPYDRSGLFNPNLFRNPTPIFNGDQSFSKLVPDWLPAPPPPLNANIFQNPFPAFNGDQSNGGKLGPDWAPVFVPPLNINLFKNNYPFFNGDQSFSKQIPDWLPAPPPPLNTNVFTNPVPIFNGDQSRSAFGPDWLPQPPTYNQNIYSIVVVTTLPFNQYDYPLADRIVLRPLPTEPLNINLFKNPFPFNQYDWSRPFRVSFAGRQPPDTLNINVFSNQFPTLNIDYTPAKRLAQQPQTPATLNINLFTNPLPILNLATTDIAPVPHITDLPQPYNLNLYQVIVVTRPFVQTEWFAVKKPPTTTAPPQTYNPNLFRNALPFNMYEYPKAWNLQQAPFDLSVSTNPNLYKNAYPILNINYVLPKKPPPAPYDYSIGTIISFIPPPPTGGSSYRLLVKHYLYGYYYEAGTIITEGVEVPIGWVPTPACEPLNTLAIQAFWNAGPRLGVERSQDFYPFVGQYVSVFRPQTGPRPIPAIYWAQVPGTNNTYILTGDGASLGAKTDA